MTVDLLRSLDTSVLSGQEQIELLVRAQAGDTSARDRLVIHTLGFIRKVARSYARTTRTEQAEDLVSAGVVGLLRAIRGFDRGRFADVTFLTYAGKSIRNEIQRAWGRDIASAYIPPQLVVEARRLRRRRAELRVDGRSNVEIDVLFSRDHSASAIEAELVVSGKAFELDAPIAGSDGERTTPHDFFAGTSPYTDGVEEQNADENVRVLVDKLRCRLHPRDRDILDRRLFPLDPTATPATLEEIGEAWGITRERVRQLEIGVLRKLETALASVQGARPGRGGRQLYSEIYQERRSGGLCISCGRPSGGALKCARHAKAKTKPANDVRRCEGCEAPLHEAWQRRCGPCRIARRSAQKAADALARRSAATGE